MLTELCALETEFMNLARANFSRAEFDRLRDLGVTDDALARAGRPGWARVRRCADNTGRFEFAGPDDQHAWAYVSPVWSWGELVDLVAWKPEQPERFARLTGRPAIMEPRVGPLLDFPHDAVRVYPHPLAWLQAGATGLAILSMDDARETLMGTPEVIADDFDFSRRLDAALDRPMKRPRVLFDDGRKAVA